MKTTDPIKSLLGVPGIGVTYAQRLVSIGITGVTHLQLLFFYHLNAKAMLQFYSHPICCISISN